MRTVVVDDPKTGCRYEVVFRDEQVRAVARDPHGKGRRGRPVDIWWHLKGEPSKHVQRIIALAREQKARAAAAPLRTAATPLLPPEGTKAGTRWVLRVRGGQAAGAALVAEWSGTVWLIHGIRTMVNPWDPEPYYEVVGPAPNQAAAAP